MERTKTKVPAPAIEFRAANNDCIDASARLDWMAGGLCIDVHENWGKDEYLVTLSRQGLSVTFPCSLFHLSAMEQALRFYLERVKTQRSWPTVETLSKPME